MHKFARKRTYLFAVVIGSALFLLTPALKADTLTIAPNPTTYNVSPGQSFTVNGTLTQTSTDSLLAFFPLETDSGFPLTFGGLDPAIQTFLGSSSSALTLYTGPIFDFTVDPLATIGATFSGTVEVLAADSTTIPTSALDTGMVPFTGTIVAAAPVPEPSSFLLLGTGLLIMLGAARRRLAL